MILFFNTLLVAHFDFGLFLSNFFFQIIDAWQFFIEIVWKNLYSLISSNSYWLIVSFQAILRKKVVLISTNK